MRSSADCITNTCESEFSVHTAVMQLTGVRIRHTPFTPERMKKALG
jgi:CO/xanthine dehydrogenase Mo-binding subunit